MLNIFLTVDTEIWPFSNGWPTVPLAATHTDFTPEIGFYIHGSTDNGSFGVPFQLACLKEHGLSGGAARYLGRQSFPATPQGWLP